MRWAESGAENASSEAPETTPRIISLEQDACRHERQACRILRGLREAELTRRLLWCLQFENSFPQLIKLRFHFPYQRHVALPQLPRRLHLRVQLR